MPELPHHDALRAELQLNDALRTAFAAALKLYGCVRCAEQEIGLRVYGHAYEAEQWIMGQQPLDPATPVPTQRDGITMRCDTPSCGDGPDVLFADGDDMDDSLPF